MYTITNVIEVEGSTINSGWKNPMVLVTTNKGVFISSAVARYHNKHGKAFNAKPGDVVEATVEDAKNAPGYQWISLKG